MYAQGVSHVQEMAELHLVSGFHPLDRAPVELGGVRQRFLGEAHPFPPYSDAVADGPAGVDDPLRLFCWHSRNALSIMIISQQQI